jgi:hypothetical protein
MRAVLARLHLLEVHNRTQNRNPLGMIQSIYQGLLYDIVGVFTVGLCPILQQSDKPTVDMPLPYR